MGRLRDHRPRFDTSVCPDQAACDRLYHPTLCAGDHCECCGDLVDADDTLPQGDDLIAVLRARHAARIAERKRIQADIDAIEKQLVDLGARYAAEDSKYGWIVRDTIKGGHLGSATDPQGKWVRVPGGITEAEARAYADRLNGKKG